MAVGNGALSRSPKIDTRIALVRENCIRTGGVYSSAGVRGVKGSQPEEEKQIIEVNTSSTVRIGFCVLC